MEPSVVYKKIVMVSDLNPAQRLYGGKMLEWLDEAAVIHAIEILPPETRLVTLKISEVVFKEPARLGDLLTFRAVLYHVGRTSLGVRVWVASLETEIVSCDVLFVAVDESGRPRPHGLTGVAGQPAATPVP